MWQHPPSEKFKRALTAVALTLLPLLYFYPVLIGQVSLMPGDGWPQNLGVHVLLGQMLRQGLLPLWNPYIFAGMPLLASIQPGVLYPPNWLFAVLLPSAAMNVVVMTTYHVALIGSYWYGRRIGMTRLGALVTSITFSFSGYLIGHVEHMNLLAASAWLPWVLLAVEELSQRARWRWVVLGAVFIGLQVFAGHPQTTCYTILLSGAYAIFSLTLREGKQQRRQFLASLVVMMVCGALLSMIQMLPTIELMRQGERASISYDYFSQYSLPPRQIFALIFPYFFGGASRPPYTLTYWGAWNANVVCGYVGMLGLLLSCIALFAACQRRKGKGEREREEREKEESERGKAKGERGNTPLWLSPFPFRLSPLIWFWAGTAAISLLLAFGGYLPLGINKLLYHVPIYNLFRGSYRHWLEFDFAFAVLAGLGVSTIVRLEYVAARRVLMRGVMVMGLMVISALIAYKFFVSPSTTPRPAPFGSLTHPDALIPVAFFVLSVLALWFYARWRTPLAAMGLIVTLLLDLASFGHFFAWRAVTFDVPARLADPPSVQFIKAREPELNNFRIVSHAALIYDYEYTGQYERHYDLLDRANVSIARGLPSINGHDPVRLQRTASLSGEMDPVGLIPDSGVFSEAHQGLSLLNVKYLLLDRRRDYQLQGKPGADGLRFGKTTLNLSVGQKTRMHTGTHIEIDAPEVEATELALVTTMNSAAEMPDGTPVVGIKLHAKDGRVIERQLLVGRDTAEWAYERADVRARIKHQRARIYESEQQDGFQSHAYLARLAFAPAQIERIELDYLRPEAELYLVRGSLYHAATGISTPLDGLQLPSNRWRKLNSFGQIELYENLKWLPRAWFVKRAQVMPSAEVLRVIKEGKLSDSTPFDPAETALLDAEDFNQAKSKLPPIGDTANAQVKITKYEAQRIELETSNSQPGFLVLSEIDYRGWDALIDGQATPVYRADYTLRGIAMPPGNHHIEFVFRSPSFRVGAICSALGVMLLLAGSVVSQRKARQKAGQIEVR